MFEQGAFPTARKDFDFAAALRSNEEVCPNRRRNESPMFSLRRRGEAGGRKRTLFLSPRAEDERT